MLPASDLSEILANLTALQLEPNTTAQILAAVLAPLLRSSGPDVDPDLQLRPRGRPRRRISRRRKKATRRAARSTDARSRAIAALRDNPNTSLTDIAKIAKVSRSAAAKAHVDPQTLEQARTDLGIVTSRANTGGAQAVQWSLPG